jgi:hypothetical protein
MDFDVNCGAPGRGGDGGGAGLGDGKDGRVSRGGSLPGRGGVGIDASADIMMLGLAMDESSALVCKSEAVRQTRLLQRSPR